MFDRRMLSSTPDWKPGTGSLGARVGSSGNVPWPRLMPASWFRSRRDALDDVQLGAVVQHHAVVEVGEAAVLDRHRVVAVVEDRGADRLAVDRLAVQVDGDLVGADDEAVADAVAEVVVDDDALRDLLAAEDGLRDRRGADRPDVGRRDAVARVEGVGCAGLSTLPFTSSTLPARSTARTWSTCCGRGEPVDGVRRGADGPGGLAGVHRAVEAALVTRAPRSASGCRCP